MVPIQGEKFKELATYSIWSDDEISRIPIVNGEVPLLPSKNIFYLRTNFVKGFENRVLAHIKKPFIFITHGEDDPIPVNSKIPDHPLLIKWYGINCFSDHPKMQPVPYGMADSDKPHGSADILRLVQRFNPPKKTAIYCNFRVGNNDAARRRLFEKARTMGSVFVDMTGREEYLKPRICYPEFLLRLASHKFALSPEGNGVDCHRIWESIYLGVVPIVLRHRALKYFEDLPILFLDNWDEMDGLDLEKTYEKVIARSPMKADFEFYKLMIETDNERK